MACWILFWEATDKADLKTFHTTSAYCNWMQGLVMPNKYFTKLIIDEAAPF